MPQEHPYNTPSRTISVWIDRPADEVYDFVASPRNLSRWASGLGESITENNGVCQATTPAGTVEIRFVERNVYRVADHCVTLPSGQAVYVPMRVIVNGTGSEVSLTLLRQVDMTDEEYDSDADWVERDLATLKHVLESNPTSEV